MKKVIAAAVWMLTASTVNAQPYVVNFNVTSPQQYQQQGFWVQGIDTRLVPPGTWTFGAGVDHHTFGGGGNVEALDGRLTVHAGAGVTSDSMLVGVGGLCSTQVTGNCFGAAGYAQALPGAAPSTAVTGAEYNTDAQVPVWAKVGISVIDVTASQHHGSNADAGIWLSKQAGASGWRHAIDVSSNGPSHAEFPATTTVLTAAGGTVPRGIDFAGMAFTDAAILLPSGLTGGIRIGNHRIFSDGVNYIVLRGGTSFPVQIDIEGDWVVIRPGGASPRAYTFDWETGTFVKQ